VDLTAAISGLQTAKVMSQIQYAVAGKVLDAQKADGAAALQLLEAASKGGSQAGDALVAAATGLGGEIDTYG
jgi:hypothetical protein